MKMNPIFFQYQKQENILDSLISKFENYNWKFKELNNINLHKFIWPEIVLSDKEPKLNNRDLMESNENIEEFPHTIDLLGSFYESENKDKNATLSGTVYLYVQAIQNTAFEFAHYKTQTLSNKLSNELKTEYINNLTTIVLIHEFTHCIIQSGIFTTNNRESSFPSKTRYYDKDSVYYHESIAQILTNYFCSKNKELNEMFNWLEQLQPQAYKEYKKLFPIKKEEIIITAQKEDQSKDIKHEISSINDEDVRNTIFSAMIMRLKDEQSFKCLKKILDNVKAIEFQKEYFNNLSILNKWNWNDQNLKDFFEQEKFNIAAMRYNV